MSAQGPQYFGTRKRNGEEGRFRQETAAQTPLPTRGQMFTKPLPGGRSLEPKKRRRSALTRPRHPFELYLTEVGSTTGWAVYPASVNGTIKPKIGGVSIFSSPVPFLTLSGDFTAYLEFDVEGQSRLLDGNWIIVPGSQKLNNVEITTDPDEASAITIDPETGEVTHGHRVYEIGVVEGGVVTAQNMRFSVQYTLCSRTILSDWAYG
jgi:hypothetical protein